MRTGRTGDRQSPFRVVRTKARQTDWEPIRELHQGQRSHAPRQQAGHMTAPDQLAKRSSKPLARRGRPHRTLRPDASGFFTASMSAVAAKGFWRQATQPTSSAERRVGSLSLAVIKITGTGDPDRNSARRKSRPEIAPSWMSRIRQATPVAPASALYASTEANSLVSKPCASSRRPTLLRTLGS